MLRIVCIGNGFVVLNRKGRVVYSSSSFASCFDYVQLHQAT